MVRIAKNTDPQKLAMLKTLINNQQYMNVAINRIAITLTEEIVNLDNKNNEYKPSR